MSILIIIGIILLLAFGLIYVAFALLCGILFFAVLYVHGAFIVKFIGIALAVVVSFVISVIIIGELAECVANCIKKCTKKARSKNNPDSKPVRIEPILIDNVAGKGTDVNRQEWKGYTANL